MTNLPPIDQTQVSGNPITQEPKSTQKVSALGHIIQAIKNPLGAIKKIAQSFSFLSQSTELERPTQSLGSQKPHKMQLSTLSEINREDIQLCDEAKYSQIQKSEKPTADAFKSCGNTLWKIGQYADELRNCYLKVNASGEENPQFLRSIQEKKSILIDELNRRLVEVKSGNQQYGTEVDIKAQLKFVTRRTSHIPVSS